MAGNFKNSAWTEDESLKCDLEKYSCQGLQRSEILSFMKRDYGMYAWSIQTLYRRMRHFGIYRTDRNVTVDDVKKAVN